jgi:hypothetical protein
MSLYNMLFGMNPDSGKLLELLGKTHGDFGRFRDVYIQDDYIVVHTRCGGGNRDDYEYMFDEMENHPWYSHDDDDDFDSTYADIFFKIPDNVLVVIKNMNQGSDPSEQWQDLFAMLTK